MAQKNAEAKAAKRDGNRSHTAGHEMIELEGMINYCTMPRCRRKHVLEHFGEDFDSKTQCNKTCDFCINPEKVENETKAAECMSAVVDSKRAMNGHRSKDDEQKFYHNPLDSDDGDGSDDFMGDDDGLMGVTEYDGGDDYRSGFPSKANGFVKASSVLDKYEVSCTSYLIEYELITRDGSHIKSFLMYSENGMPARQERWFRELQDENVQ
jgi:hypothetical protein